MPPKLGSNSNGILLMNIITTLAASVLMSPANVATDVPKVQIDTPTYDWKTQKVLASKEPRFGSPTTMYSTNPTICVVFQQVQNDDTVPID